MKTTSGRVLSRRRFLRRAAGHGRTLELSCERLYIRYLEAADAGNLPGFLSAVTAEVGCADEIRLVKCEWLARDDFRRALERALRDRFRAADLDEGRSIHHSHERTFPSKGALGTG